MRDAATLAIHLKDYAPPAFLISHVALEVDIRPGAVHLRSTLKVARNALHGVADAAFVLDGENLELLSIRMDGSALAAGEFATDAAHLTIVRVPDAFTLETVVRFDPWKNTRLEGLYATRDGLVTQCEAQSVTAKRAITSG